MQNSSILSKLIMLLSMTIFSLNSYADGGEDKIFKRWFESKNNGISAVKFEQYNDLCGTCHFSFQPGLLPGLSWEKVMNNLDNHFGQTLKMTDVEARTMRRYLLDNSAGHVNDEISNQILQSLKYNPVPVRITKTPFFVYKHDRLQKKGSIHNIGQCDSCHEDARQGYYNKHEVRIPEQSQWHSNDVKFKM
ncbi:MAG: cytochrome C [Gammaproteobacteria bacterium]|nr:cytochrome C [Gammaproteobacteria bacterium]